MNTSRLMSAAISAGAVLITILALSTTSAASAATLSASADNWSAASPATSPPQLTGPAMAYDPQSQQTILFGYSGGAAQTWDWNGYTWTNLTAPDGPTPRGYSSLAYDPAIGDLVLFGGTAPGNTLFAQTWLWNGSDWTALGPVGTVPPARYNASLAYDPATSQLILFGGQTSTGYLGDTWTLNSSNLQWTQLDPSSSPVARAGAALGYDTATQQLVLYGGQGQANYADTWLWTGTNWTSADNPAPVPAVRAFASFAYDPTTGQMILFGGEGASTYSDTWNWTGTAWQELSPATNPGSRSMAAAAYDSATDQLVLFGGMSGSGVTEADTWTYGPPPAAPAITSADSATFTAGNGGSFSFTSSGYPLPLHTVTDGGLPAGVSLSPAGVLSGTPASDTGGAYPVLITASNSVGSAATQEFTLVVDQAPIITSLHSETFVEGTAGKFKVKASAYPKATFTETGALPAGLTLSKSGVLSGTPTVTGTFKIKLIATNSAGTSKQSFTLTVAASTGNGSAPIITSLDNAAFVVASPGKFTVKANETATFTETGALPAGVTLSPSGVLSGTPEAEGTYKIELIATNSSGTGKQSFTLTVEA